VRLRDVVTSDLDLYVRMRCDPAMMTDLGGPLPRDGMEEVVRRDVEAVALGRAMALMIVPGDDGIVAGTVVLWSVDPGQHTGPVSEIGWMVLPEFQGKGIATSAVRMVLDRARIEGGWGVVHATPSVTNTASNRICQSLGFTLTKSEEREWAGRAFQVNSWQIDLSLSNGVR
jgi:RimJ/RimL family protein N-acetyltransferase